MYGCFYRLGGLFAGVLVARALPFWVYMEGFNFWKLSVFNGVKTSGGGASATGRRRKRDVKPRARQVLSNVECFNQPLLQSRCGNAQSEQTGHPLWLVEVLIWDPHAHPPSRTLTP